MGGRAAWRTLDRGRGAVLATFERCLYLEAGDALCCIGGGDFPGGPLNLRLEGFRVPPATAGIVTSWHYGACTLRIGGRFWSLGERSLWTPPEPPAWTAASVSAGLRACRAAAMGGEEAARRPTALASRITAGLRDAGSALLDWLRHAPGGLAGFGAVPREALALLGCGPGLTPSGDDLLVGALVTLHAGGRHETARALAAAVMAEAPRRTSRVSTAHLAAACEGEAVQPVHDVVRALLSGDTSACGPSVRQLLTYGQSSGADALRGILLAADAFNAA